MRYLICRIILEEYDSEIINMVLSKKDRIRNPHNLKIRKREFFVV
jgi:hypothetical protein